MFATLVILYSLSLVASSTCGVNEEYTLQMAINPVLQLVNFNAIHALLNEASSDPQIKGIIDYTKTPPFKHMVEKIQKLRDFEILTQTLFMLGLDVFDYLNKLHDLLDLPHIPAKSILDRSRRRRNIENFLDKLFYAIPALEIQKMYRHKMFSDELFITGMHLIDSPILYRIVEDTAEMPEWKEFNNYMEGLGIDTMKSLKRIQNFIKTTIQPRHFDIRKD